MKTQDSVLGYSVDLYLHKHKLAIEVDKLGILVLVKRQKVLEKKLYCVFIRINPDGKNFNIFKEINNLTQTY